MSRPVTRALLATAGITLTATGAFSMLMQPGAAAAENTPSLCLLSIPPLDLTICLPSGTPPPTSPTATTSTTPTSTTSPTATASSSATSSTTVPSSATPTLNPGVSTTYVVPSTQKATPVVAQTTAAAAAGPNLTVSGLTVAKVKRKLVATATVANTGSVALTQVGITVKATGERPQKYTLQLPPGRQIRFHTRWAFKTSPKKKVVTVSVDPSHVVAETNEADNVVKAAKRFR